VWVLIDGVGDVEVPGLGYRTPLEAARTPALDALARVGRCGLQDTAEPGLACGSDTAHLELLGYPPQQYYRGRGAFESMGAGIEMGPGDIAFKCNFATLDPTTGVVTSRRCDRDFTREGPVLCAALDGMSLPSFPEHTVAVQYATEHRCGVCIRGPGLTDAVSGTDPLKDNLPLLRCTPTDASPEASHTAAVVEELSRVMQEVLSSHPINASRAAQDKPVANVVLLRGCGVRLSAPTFLERHGLRAFMIAPTRCILGIGMSAGIEPIHVPGATGDYHTRLDKKAEALAQHILSGRYDLGFCHIKAVDDCGHDRNVEGRVAWVEKLDAFVGQVLTLLAGIADDCVMVVGGDHSTPVLFGDHSHEPVPFVMARLDQALAAYREQGVQSAPQDSTGSAAGLGESLPYRPGFHEKACAAGALGRFLGGEVMAIIKEGAGYA